AGAVALLSYATTNIAYLLTGSFIIGIVGAFWLTPNLATLIPENAGTLRALVHYHVGPSADGKSPASHSSRWRGRQYVDVAVRVRQIICENIGVDPEQLSEDSRFIEDLGC